MKKKFMSLILAGFMALTVLAGCGGAKGNDDVINIGVIQQMQHGSLDAAYEGFVDGLKDAGYVDGENIKINFQNASGDINNCQSITQSFANNGVDMVLAIATNAAQAAVNEFQDTDVPVLFTAVTDPVDAGLVESNEAPGKNVTGTSDMPVIADQIAVIKDILPEAKILGILYTSSESNSELQAEEAKKAAEELGMEVKIQTASSTNDIAQVVASVAGEVDAIYIPSDNAFASAMATVNSTAVDNQLPVFCAVEDMIKEGGIATTAVDYYELGKQTAAQAVRILKGEKASEIAVETQKEFAFVVNKTFAESVGVEIPAEILEKAATTY
ncbi:MAG: ABC transporter substrate-binding protein [Roseburia sp.]|nr:ABC transporter substrate-binding protein [Roseburia sp.]